MPGRLTDINQYPNRLRLLILIVALTCRLLPGQAQSTAISGVVNSYFRVIDVVPAKSCVLLSSVSGLGFNDKIMLIQMKGATINTTASSASFGDTTGLNNAGNYEINTVCGIVGDSVFLVYSILNNYTVADRVQLVRIPQYYAATVTDTLKAAPWNPTSGTGGVLAIMVETDLTLNAPISADSAGYRGGRYVDTGDDCDNSTGTLYAYNGNTLPTHWGAFKGEGVATVANSQSGGMGAPANGGGGGNNHNNGGGGGANLSAAGIGGGNSSALGCRQPFPGRAGKALRNHGGRKIFAGGGGGAGHANNGYVGSNGGGHGGGIVFIKADRLIGNAQYIAASGQIGGPAASDGASGGGAGGTIILDITNYSGSATIRATGGTGGTESDGGNIGRCYGSGGGGSGGVVYFSGANPGIGVSITGGGAGPETGRDATCHAIVASGSGEAGVEISNYSYRRSMTLANNYCSILLPVRLLSFSAKEKSGAVLLQWSVAGDETIERYIVERKNDWGEWMTILELGSIENANSALDPSPLKPTNYYRIVMISRDGTKNYSSVRKVVMGENKATLRIYPNPATDRVTVSGVGPGMDVFLHDLSGKLLTRSRVMGSAEQYTLQLPPLAPGVYILQAGMTRERVIVKRQR